MMEYQEILFEKKERIARVTLNRPKTLNAMSPMLIDELNRAFDEIEEDDDVRVAIITGAGDRAFSAGIDLGKPGEPFAYRSW